MTSGGGDPDEGTAWTAATALPNSAKEAERFVLSYHDHNYEDDLRGAVPIAEETVSGRCEVRIALVRPRY